MAKSQLTRLQKAERRLALAKLNVKVARLIEQAVNEKPKAKEKTNDAQNPKA